MKIKNELNAELEIVSIPFLKIWSGRYVRRLEKTIFKNEMNSEIQNATRYRTRKENKGKQNRDNTTDKELTIMKMDHKEFDCIKDNSSSLAPGSHHPEGLFELQAYNVKIKMSWTLN